MGCAVVARRDVERAPAAARGGAGAANRGDLDQARSLFDALLPWIQDMEGGSYNQKAKLGLAHVGIPCGGVRQPLLPLADADATEHLRVLGEALAAPVAPPLPA